MRSLLRSKIVVQLFSCGWYSLGLEKANCYTAEKFGDLVEEKINEKLSSDYGINAVFDVCNGNDPQYLKHFRNHWGENFKILEDFFSSPACTETLKSVKDNIGIDDATPREVCIAACCKSGRHRGVAMCAFLREILKRLGFTVRDTLHVNDDRWNHLCTGEKPWICFHCSDRSFALKKELFDRAFEVFKSL